MSVEVAAQTNDFGAVISGVDLKTLNTDTVQQIRSLWLRHQVVAFPDQLMNLDQLAAFTRLIGDFGNDPYVAPVREHPHVLEIRREPDEAAAPFGAAWHSDWSFQTAPPAATILHASIVPPIGGDTLYADGCAAFEALASSERSELRSMTALHSARRPYSLQGFYASGGDKRSMKILPHDSALEITEHPLVRTHPETGREVLWINSVYTIGIKDMDEAASDRLLKRLFAHSVEDRFVYRHRWQPNMLTMWDNRSVQHCAQGGYDGHRRIMYRTTVAGDQPFLR